MTPRRRKERVYALQDANWKTSAIVAAAGVPGATGATVISRFAYTPYGEAQTLTASWAPPGAGTTPATPWAHLFQGLGVTDVTGLAHARNRDYSASLGRFITLDPIGFQAGDNNWYRFVENGPTGKVDPSGLWAWDDDWIQMGVGGLLGFYGPGVAADGLSANMNVAIHTDIHAQAAAAREKAWRAYHEATNPVDAGANLLFGVGLNAVGEGCAHGGFGIAEVVTLGGLRGGRCAAPRGLVAQVGESAKNWLGKDYRVITNRAGDRIFMSKDGLRKMRFDFNNTQGDLPHVHLEVFKNGRWQDAIPGTHRIYPQP